MNTTDLGADRQREAGAASGPSRERSAPSHDLPAASAPVAAAGSTAMRAGTAHHREPSTPPDGSPARIARHADDCLVDLDGTAYCVKHPRPGRAWFDPHKPCLGDARCWAVKAGWTGPLPVEPYSPSWWRRMRRRRG